MTNLWKPIEGETPLDDLSGLKLKIKNPNRKIIHEYEARNIQKAFEKYFLKKPSNRTAPFDLKWLKKLHEEMYGHVWDWAGGFRTTNKSIGCDANQIQMQLLQLLSDLEYWQQETMPFIEQATRVHHRAVLIHPFENGNGRWSRALANIWLRLYGQPMVLWPATIDAESTIRVKYIDALRKADGLDYAELLEMHTKYQDKT